ncbi:MAG TPA: erythromycin esterase family protein [Thermomicrobiales bacterium]|nr:erythromycin esterase family protein [Thermomicrobiales bacterium]
MRNATTMAPAEAVRAAARPLAGAATDYDGLLDQIGDAHFALIGEASHGTEEFYAERARITQRLIAERGFTAVAVEADWPDAYRVNRYARGMGDDTTPEQALGGFKRFPTWMWRNTVVRDFAGWLREYNAGRPAGQQAGFYGLDLYSLYGSMAAVVEYLDRVDPEAARRARQRYGCFEHFRQDTEAYGYATSFGGAEPCEDEVVGQLVELQRHRTDYAHLDGRVAADEYFFAEQNARLVKNAEEYYRAMFRGRNSSWNLRDRHMAETLDALVGHLDAQAGQAGHTKVVVWAHNSHLGDARATELGRGGELNVGQLVRERHGRDATLVGFSTDHGTVTAASDWDLPAERKRVRPGLAGSYEALFHEVGLPRFLLTLRDGDAPATLREPRLERAIGVVYRPETERYSHYFEAWLPEQFDALLYFDETRAVEPLERTPGWETGEAPETFPFRV